jgi:hypothetical protein
MMKDLFRHKDKLLVLDKADRLLTRMTIATPGGRPPDRLHPHPLGAGRLHEPEAVRGVLVAAVPQDDDRHDRCRPDPDADVGADCTKRLEVIKDIPPGKCIYWFERTDMVKAFEVLGDRVALRGNLSPSLLTTGTPEEVDAAVRHLVDKVWNKGGKLILDGAFGIPDETPVANVRAMFNAARKYAG